MINRTKVWLKTKTKEGEGAQKSCHYWDLLNQDKHNIYEDRHMSINIKCTAH